MADVTIGARLTLDANDGIKSVKDFRQQLKEATGDALALAEKFGATSKEASAAAMRVAELKDKMEDSRKLIDAFNPETKFRAFSASLNTVVGGFTALQGVMGLVGVESADLQKQLAKVQSALALSQGIAQLQEGIKTFKNLGAVIQSTTLFQKANNVATATASVLMRAFGVTVDTTSTAFKFLKGAIVATGIGALIVILSEVASAMDLFGSSTEKAADEQKKLQDSIDGVNESLRVGQDFLKREESLDIARAKQRGASEAEIFKIKQQYRKLDFQATTDAYDKVKNLDEKAAADFIKRLKEINTEGQVARIEFETAEAERQKKAAEEARKRQLEQARKDFEEKNRLERARFTGGALPGGLSGKSPEDIETDRKLAAAKNYYDGLQDLRLSDRDNEEIYTSDLESQARERMRIAEAEYQNRKVLLESTSNLLGALSDLVGKQTVAGKALAIAQATINTFVGATEVLRSPSVLPEPIATINKLINVAAIIASGISAVKNIAKTQVPGGGGGASPSISNASVNAPLAPQKPVTQQTQLDQQTLNAIGNSTVRAFVIESDVSGSQERIRRLNRQARLG